MKIRFQLLKEGELFAGYIIPVGELEKATITLPKDVIFLSKQKKIGEIVRITFDKKNKGLLCTMKISDKDIIKSLKMGNK